MESESEKHVQSVSYLSAGFLGRSSASIGGFALSFMVLFFKLISIQNSYVIMLHFWAVATLFFLIASIFKYGIKRLLIEFRKFHQTKYCYGAMFAQGFQSVMFISGAIMTNAAVVLILFSTNCLQVGLISHFIYDTKLTVHQMVSIFFGFVGICTMVIPSLSANPNDVGAYFVCFGASVGMAWFLICSQQVSIRAPDVDVTLFIFGNGGISVLVGLIVSAIQGELTILSAQDFIWIMLGGCVMLPTAFSGFSYAATKIHPAEVSLLALFEVIFGPIWTYIFLDEKPSFWTLFGGAIILASISAFIVMSMKSEEKNKTTMTATSV